MLAIKEGRARESFQDRNAQVADRRVPSSRQATRPHVSLWNRVSAFGCIGICTAILWFIAGIGAKIDTVNNDIYRTQVEMQTVSANNASLTAKVDSLTKPTRILHVAMSEFHMHYVNPIVISAGNR